MRDDDGHGRQIEKEPSIHNWVHPTTKMPWHSPDKPFGMTQSEYEDLMEEAATTIEKVECSCGLPGAVYVGNKWYCFDCFTNGDDEDA
jgi:hypothetical protein